MSVHGSGSGAGSSSPRIAAGGGVVLYGGSPPMLPSAPWEPPDPIPPSPWTPPGYPPMPASLALALCPRCSRHVRAEEPCPFCLRADLDAFRDALGEGAKPAERIAQLEVALRAAVQKLREISHASGGGLDALVAECERALAREK